MQNKKCHTCVFGDKCTTRNGCAYYAPIDGEMTDAEIKRLVERKRRPYYIAWLSYVADYD